MEQGQDRQIFGNNVRTSIKGQKIRRFLTTLVVGGLTLASASAPTQAAPVASSSTSFDSAKAWDLLRKQCDFGPRPPGKDAHIKCRDLILKEVTKYCDNARLQTFSHTWSSDGKPYDMWNVVGEQNWKDAKVRVVLMAHWDTRPTADQEPLPSNQLKPILGANDGASGVAVLLELMRVMKAKKLNVGIQYVLVDGEDLGPGLDEMFLGARNYVKTLLDEKPQYGILLDMIGDKDLEVPIESYSYFSARDVAVSLYRHAASIGLKSSFPNVVGQAIQDDHLSLINADIPTVDLIDFSYEPWHTLRDTPDKCSAESLGKVGKLLESFLSQSEPFIPAKK